DFSTVTPYAGNDASRGAYRLRRFLTHGLLLRHSTMSLLCFVPIAAKVSVKKALCDVAREQIPQNHFVYSPKSSVAISCKKLTDLFAAQGSGPGPSRRTTLRRPTVAFGALRTLTDFHRATMCSE